MSTMPIRRFLSPLVALALLAMVSRPSAAQATCAPGTLQSYIDAGSCQFGGVTFFGFNFGAFGPYTDPNVLYTLPDPSTIGLTPMVSTSGATTRVTFDLSGYAASMTVLAPEAVDSEAHLGSYVQFFGTTAGSFTGIRGSVSTTYPGGMLPPPTAGNTPTASASLFAAGPFCDYGFPPLQPGVNSFVGACVPGSGFIELNAAIDISTANGTFTRPTTLAPGSAALSLDGVGLDVTATPEPQTFALVLPGLVLAGTTIRRRRAGRAARA